MSRSNHEDFTRALRCRVRHAGPHALAPLVALATILLTVRASAQVPGYRPNSCWGNCGYFASSSAGQLSCACDSSCETYGDCCQDKHTYCPVITVDGSTQNLCPFIPPTGSIYGTDLGFNFQEGSYYNVLFGDTWQSNSSVCGSGTPPAPPTRDDALASIPAVRPSWITAYQAGTGSCQPLVSVTGETGSTFSPIRLETNQACSLLAWCGFADTCDTYSDGTFCTYATGWLRTPLGGFMSGSNAFIFYERDDMKECVNKPCASGFTCSACPSGATCLSSDLPANLYAGSIATNVCLDTGSASYGVTPVNQPEMNIELAMRNGAGPGSMDPSTTFIRVAQFATTKFMNLSVKTVAAFNPVLGTTPNYADGQGAVLIWGRPGFTTASGELPLFFGYQALPLTVTGTGHNAQVNWAPTYYGGTNKTTGQITWTTSQSLAVPLTTNMLDSTHFYDDVSKPMQTNVAWIPALRKWIMMYGGDVPDFFYPATSEPPEDSPRTGAILFRMSDNPWGPWTPPVPVLDRYEVATAMACDSPAPTGYDNDLNGDGIADSYATPGPWIYPFESLVDAQWKNGCTVGDARRPNKAVLQSILGVLGPYCANSPTNPPKSLERGNLYSPNVITGWTNTLATSSSQPYTRAADIYWSVATWNPYKEDLISTTIKLPDPEVVYSTHPIQLRNSLGAMVVASAGAPVPTGHAPTDPNVPITVLRASGTSTGDVLVGDTIALQTTQGYLARVVGSTSAITYVPTITPEAKWTVVLRSNGGANNTITKNQTQIALSQPFNGATEYLQSSSTALSVGTTLGTNANFTPTWECAAGDTCGGTR